MLLTEANKYSADRVSTMNKLNMKILTCNLLFAINRYNKLDYLNSIESFCTKFAIKYPNIYWGKYWASCMGVSKLTDSIESMFWKQSVATSNYNQTALNNYKRIYEFLNETNSDIIMEEFYDRHTGIDNLTLIGALYSIPELFFTTQKPYWYTYATTDVIWKLRIDWLTILANSVNLRWKLTEDQINQIKNDLQGKSDLVDAFIKAGIFEKQKIQSTQTQSGQSNIGTTADSTQATTASSQPNNNTTQPATSKQPKSNYKSSGPQSANVPALTGSNVKQTLSGDVYWIIADKTGKNLPHAFVHPVENPSVGEKAKLNSNGDCLVLFGSGNGYTDCTCFFKDNLEADTFLQKLIQSNSNAKQAQNLRVVKNKVDPNGYYEVSTEYGINVYIKALKLNEELIEETFIDFPYSEEEYKKGYQINDLDLFTEWLQKSVN